MLVDPGKRGPMASRDGVVDAASCRAPIVGWHAHGFAWAWRNRRFTNAVEVYGADMPTQTAGLKVSMSRVPIAVAARFQRAGNLLARCKRAATIVRPDFEPFPTKPWACHPK